jgi:hypothetical protein
MHFVKHANFLQAFLTFFNPFSYHHLNSMMMTKKYTLTKLLSLEELLLAEDKLLDAVLFLIQLTAFFRVDLVCLVVPSRVFLLPVFFWWRERHSAAYYIQLQLLPPFDDYIHER